MRARLLVPALAAGFAHGVPAVSCIPALRRRWPQWGPISNGRGRADHVALTFDDGPDRAGTLDILEVLHQLGVRATFFVLGEMVQRHPDVLRAVHDQGHEVGVHGWDHRSSLLRATPAAGVGRTLDLVETITGQHPVHYRPPYGIVSAGVLHAASQHGLRVVLWTAWGKDWEADATPESVLGTLQPDLHGGATVLLHDSDCTSSPEAWRATLGALAPLAADVRGRGLRLGPLAEHG